MRLFLYNIKRLCGKNAAIAVFLTTALCLYSSYFTGDNAPPTILEAAIRYLGGERGVFSGASYQLVISYYDNSYWFPMLLPVILSLPAVSDFYDEWFGGGYYFSLPRQGVLKYALSKAAAYSACAVLCFAAGFLIYALAAVCVFPGGEQELLKYVFPNGFLPDIMSRVLNTAASCACYPVICVITVICVKEKFLSLSLPLILNYVTGKISGDLQTRYYAENETAYLRGALLTPYMQGKQSLYFETAFNAPTAVWYAAQAFLLAGLAAILFGLVKRRTRYG